MAVLPAKGEWRWVVLAACFLSTVANSTIFYAFGTFVLPWMDEFSATAASIMSVTSCGSSISAMACPIASYFVQRWGYRTAHVVGGGLLVTSFSATSFAPSLELIFFTYSILGGFGSSLCMVSFVNAIAEHFQKNQALAFAVVTSAYGVGGFVFPLYFEALIDVYGWRGAMLVTSAVFGHVAICGLLLYPVSSVPPLPKVPCCHSNTVKECRPTRTSTEVSSDSDGLSKLEEEKDEEISSRFSSHDISDAVQLPEKSLCVKMFSFCARDVTKVDKNFNIEPSQVALTAEKREELMGKERSFLQILKILLKSSRFYIVIVHNIATYVGFFLIFALTPIRASYDLHLTDEQAFVLISTMGIPQCIVRIIFGALVNMKWMKATTIYLGGFALAGVLTLLSLAANTYPMQILYCLANSTCFAAVAFYHVLVFEMYDNNLFNVAFGCLEAMHGIGIITGPLIGGVIFDVTGSCTFSFLFAGLSILFGTFFLPCGLTFTGNIRRLNF